MTSGKRAGTTLALCAALLFAGPAAEAAAGTGADPTSWLSRLFGKANSAPADAAPASPRQRVWTIHDFTTVTLVPREAGPAMTHGPLPIQAQVQVEGLRQQLAQVQWVSANGAQPLFGADELAELAVPLAQALALAGPQDDVLLLSASRRDGGFLVGPTAVTARLFVQGEQLQLIVHDARFEFYDRYRGTDIPPQFTYGSRNAAGALTLRSAGASNTRADWLSIPLRELGPAVPAAPAAVAAPASRAAMAASAAMPPPLPAPAIPTAPRKPIDAAGAEEIERRLETLKRLRDKNLITEDEYQLKRKEILQSL